MPARFVVDGGKRFFLAIANGLDAAGADTLDDERLYQGAGAIGAEGEVVFFRSAVVAVALDHDVDVGMLDEELGICRRRSLVADAQVVTIEIEEDGQCVVAGRQMEPSLRRLDGRGAPPDPSSC